MDIYDLINRQYGSEARRRFYTSLITWFKRAGLLPSWINYQQDIDLLIANSFSDWERFDGQSERGSPASATVELKRFLLWQLPKYSSFDEEGLPGREALEEVIDRLVPLELEEVFSVLEPIGKCSLDQFRDATDKFSSPKSTGPGVSPPAA